MIEEIERLLNDYWSWLKQKTKLKELGSDVVEIQTPYLDRNNDYIQIYTKKEENKYLLSDDGYTINDLILSGCDLTSPKRQNILNITLNGFGVKKNADGALYVLADSGDFSIRKHTLLQAILAVNDLFYVASPIVNSLFIEDVSLWLDTSDIRYTPRVKFSGKSGYDHIFDFVIPKSKASPERILKAINKPNRESAQSLVFSWIDTKETRSPDAKAFAILNDSDITPTTEVISAFSSYQIKPILWSQRSQTTQMLAN